MCKFAASPVATPNTTVNSPTWEIAVDVASSSAPFNMTISVVIARASSPVSIKPLPNDFICAPTVLTPIIKLSIAWFPVLSPLPNLYDSTAVFRSATPTAFASVDNVKNSSDIPAVVAKNCLILLVFSFVRSFMTFSLSASDFPNMSFLSKNFNWSFNCLLCFSKSSNDSMLMSLDSN